jgi:predicted Ser/Thr protein kinase
MRRGLDEEFGGDFRRSRRSASHISEARRIGIATFEPGDTRTRRRSSLRSTVDGSIAAGSGS